MSHNTPSNRQRDRYTFDQTTVCLPSSHFNTYCTFVDILSTWATTSREIDCQLIFMIKNIQLIIKVDKIQCGHGCMCRGGGRHIPFWYKITSLSNAWCYWIWALIYTTTDPMAIWSRNWSRGWGGGGPSLCREALLVSGPQQGSVNNSLPCVGDFKYVHHGHTSRHWSYKLFQLVPITLIWTVVLRSK